MDKATILESIHTHLSSPVAQIAATGLTKNKKAEQVNALVAAERERLVGSIANFPLETRGTLALTIQYCCTVASLEYRHQVWPYEYMAFSRRIGELWEAFCKTAWTYPVKQGVQRISHPHFRDVKAALLKRVKANVGVHDKGAEILADIDTLFELVGDINMKEDEVFSSETIPHIIDFKSGFGSNEKGNMLRLLTVGRAYKIWDHRTRLMLLVRQEANNNYLNVLRKSKLWDVYTGVAAYQQIEELTGGDIQSVRDQVINWERDLSPSFYQFLKAQPTDLTTYLEW